MSLPLDPFDHDELSLIPTLEAFNEITASSRRALIHEPLLIWAAAEWKRRFPEMGCVPLWTANDCINRLVLDRLKPGRKLSTTGIYREFELIPCPVAIPISWRQTVKRRGNVQATSAGAVIFTLEQAGQAFPVLFVGMSYIEGNGIRVCSIVLCPPFGINLFHNFETVCVRLAKQIDPVPKIQVIGGQEKLFDAQVNWDDLILSVALKAEIRHEMDAFFDQGIKLYHELKLPPFRKLLFVGPPGTGKSTLCAALAKHALRRKMLVIYVSAADIQGASFAKIYQALRLVADAKYPTLLIIEELDVWLNARDKSQILNVLDGLEAPNNPRGVLLIATTNYPEIIDERIAKRPGRIDRIFMIPPIEDQIQALQMLKRYMNTAFREEHDAVLPNLIGKTGAFVREIALHSRMAALTAGLNSVSLEMLQHAIFRLATQLDSGSNLHSPLVVELPASASGNEDDDYYDEDWDTSDDEKA